MKLGWKICLRKFLNVNVENKKNCLLKVWIKNVHAERWQYSVSFTGITSPAVRRMRVTRTGNTLWANQRARKEVFRCPDTILDLLHAAAAEPALNAMVTETLKGAWHKPCASLPLGSLFMNTVFNYNNEILLNVEWNIDLIEAHVWKALNIPARVKACLWRHI